MGASTDQNALWPGSGAAAAPGRAPVLPGAARLVLGLLWLLTGCHAGPIPPPSGPNVLLISIDMLRPERLSCYGNPRPTSPAIDRLASSGVLFEQHISSTSWTLPAHTALFTGLPDSVHGVTDVRATALAPGFRTLAELYQKSGYATAGFFSGPYLHPAFGLGQGFDVYENCTATQGALDERERDEWIFDREVMLSSHRDITGPRVYEAARAWLEDNHTRPFFAFVHFWDVHFDFIPPAPYDRMFDPEYQGPIDGRDFYFDNERYGPKIPARDLEHLLALYDAELRWTDSFVEKLLQDLERWGLAENTIVVLTSDHGSEFFEHGWKCHRSTLFDEQIRAPLILRAPGQLPAGVRIPTQTSITDVMPTLLELCGLVPPPGLFGESLLPLARGESVPARVAFAELEGDFARLRCVRTPAAKLIHDLKAGSFALYDLTRDPGEQQPIRDLSSPLATELVHSLKKMLERVESARALHPHGPILPDLGPELHRQLREFGYVGD